MQKIKKLKYMIFSLVISMFIFTGCSCSFFGSKTLQTPIVGMDRQEQELTWYTITRADEYVIYLNDEELITVDNNKNLLEQTYNFSSHLDEYGIYKFKIKAVADGFKDSQFSSVVTYGFAN